MGTYNYLALVEAVVQEIGVTLAFALDPKETTKVFVNRDILSIDSFAEAMDIHLDSIGLRDDLNTLDREIHRMVGNLFAKYKDFGEIKPFVSNYIE